jgi:acetylornithine deacetylase/succinyl-diaminopimelate desuccinylase-like protein
VREPDLIPLACRMISTPSGTTLGTRVLAERLAAEVLAATDLSWSIDPGDEPDQVNLIATKALGGGAAPVLFNSHLDTVPPGDASLWSECGGDPFSPTIRNGRLYGLGAADAKLDWLCKALALRRSKGRRLSRGVIFAGTFGEERGLRGARHLVGRLPQRPSAVWVGEPTELHLVTRHKGMLVVSIRASARAEPALAGGQRRRLLVHGKAVHSSTPDLGENAIVRALDLARSWHARIDAIHGGDAANKVPATCEIEITCDRLELPARVDELRLEGSSGPPLAASLGRFLHDLVDEQRRILAVATIRDPSFSPPGLTSNLGRIAAEGERVEATLDFRCVPGESPDPILAALDRFAETSRRTRVIEIEVEVERDNPPLHTPAGAPVVTASLAALAAVGRPLDLASKAGCTEAGVYAQAGIPAVVVGPGRSAGNIHAPNEHVPIGELEAAVDLYAQIIEAQCA